MEPYKYDPSRPLYQHEDPNGFAKDGMLFGWAIGLIVVAGVTVLAFISIFI